jgi:hypothetical protein
MGFSENYDYNFAKHLYQNENCSETKVLKTTETLILCTNTLLL